MNCGRDDKKYTLFRSMCSGKKFETELLVLKKPPGMQGELQRVIESSKKFGQVERIQAEIHAKHLEWLHRNEPKLLTRQLTADVILKAAKMMRDATPTLHQSYFAVINRNREHECREFPSFESVEVYAKDVPEVYEGEIGRIETVVGDVRCIIANNLCPEDRVWLFGEQTIKRYTEVEAFIDDPNQTDRHHAPVVPDRGEDVPPGARGQASAGGQDVHGIGPKGRNEHAAVSADAVRHEAGCGDERDPGGGGSQLRHHHAGRVPGRPEERGKDDHGLVPGEGMPRN